MKTKTTGAAEVKAGQEIRTTRGWLKVLSVVIEPNGVSLHGRIIGKGYRYTYLAAATEVLEVK
jgi:hypothetical protein